MGGGSHCLQVVVVACHLKGAHGRWEHRLHSKGSGFCEERGFTRWWSKQEARFFLSQAAVHAVGGKQHSVASVLWEVWQARCRKKAAQCCKLAASLDVYRARLGAPRGSRFVGNRAAYTYTAFHVDISVWVRVQSTGGTVFVRFKSE